MKIMFPAISCLLINLSVFADSTVNSNNKYSYGANIGWADFRGDGANGAAVGEYFCTGSVWSANCGWISLGNGPTNGFHYSNAAADDWGVNHDGLGNLSGYAYGGNIGWITFDQSQGQPRIDLLTGNLSGSAWAANVGWISLSNAYAHVQTDRLSRGADSNANNIPDAWEKDLAGDLATLQGGSHDQDGDGVTDRDEYLADTDPLDPADKLKITLFTVQSQTNKVVWTCRRTRFYALEETNALTGGTRAWGEESEGLLVPQSSSLMTQTVTGVESPTRFYRIKAVVPLSE